MNRPEKCFITGLPTQQYRDGRDGLMCYKIILNNKEYYFAFSIYPYEWTETVNENYKKTATNYIQEKIKNVKHILFGLILNDKWPVERGLILNKNIIDKILIEADYPKTPKDKLENLFINLASSQTFDGEAITFFDSFFKQNIYLIPEYFCKYYFRTTDEILFYLNTLENSGFIKIEKANNEKHRLFSYQLTYKGLESFVKLKDEGANSNNCFVAMSFDKEEEKVFYDAIKPACEETGFKAIRVDKQDIKSDKTINDIILSLIKKSKFCIADFTKQKAGVYFESGYALGIGMDVIYICKRSDFDKCHFDTNHYHHILYDDIEELKKELIATINVKIKK